MFRVMLVVVGLGAVLAQHREGMPKCGRIMHGGLECCKKEMMSPGVPPDDVKECLAVPKKPPPSCELEICIAQKRGYGKADGTVDKAEMQKFLESKMMKNDADLAKNMVANCVNGDLSKFGRGDMCEMMKMKLCMDVEIIKNCDEWKDEGDCSGMQDLADECVKEFS